MKMTSSSLSALVARLRVRGGDRGAARRGWVWPVCGCAAGPVAARGVCAARPGRREHERGPGRQQRREAHRGRGRRGWEARIGTSAAQAWSIAGHGVPQGRVDVPVCLVHDGGAANFVLGNLDKLPARKMRGFCRKCHWDVSRLAHTQATQRQSQTMLLPILAAADEMF